eukprot:m.77438 g.77438  ORF g.77438 m.77438 type:complete len:146 (+) comp25015_c1_seq1:197-634(+)
MINVSLSMINVSLRMINVSLYLINLSPPDQFLPSSSSKDLNGSASTSQSSTTHPHITDLNGSTTHPHHSQRRNPLRPTDGAVLLLRTRGCCLRARLEMGQCYLGVGTCLFWCPWRWRWLWLCYGEGGGGEWMLRMGLVGWHSAIR